MLLKAGATIDAQDMNGDSPLTWASWHLRPDSILKKLCYGEFKIHPKRRPMGTSLLESAIYGSLVPGQYTAMVRGKAKGVGVVEIYNIR